MVIDYSKKGYKIAVVAIVFALIAIASATGIQYLENVYCLNCTLDNPTFVNYTFPSGSNLTQSQLDLKLNKSGDTMSGNLNMGNKNIINIDQILDVSDSDNLYVQVGNTKGARTYYNAYGSLQYLQGYVWNASTSSSFTQYPTYFSFTKYIDMNNNNIINCANCISQTNLDTKVNKSGDNMTGYLNIQGMRIGDFRNSSTQGFSMLNTSYQGAFTVYNDASYMYMGQSVNTFYDGSSGGSQGWHKTNTSLDSVITQQRVNLAGGNGSSIDVYFSAPTTQDPFLNFNQVSSQTATSTVFMKKVVLSTAGKGIQLTAPNGNPYCVTVSNLGVLTTTAGACT
jgi:hypothetical protein